MSLDKLNKKLNTLKKPAQAEILSRFFKTAKGQYGEGDIFLGIKVPQQRILAKEFVHLSLKDLQQLINSKIHEHRLISLLILTYKYPKASIPEKKLIVKFYIKNSKKINNWDLVDLSAPKILGAYLLENPQQKSILYEFAKSKNLWQKRISILATYTLIKQREFKDTLSIAEILRNDDHDLIHKAVGWMLREIGKIDQLTEEKFLDKHFKKMPRTMLRYAIEKFNEPKRQHYLKKT